MQHRRLGRWGVSVSAVGLGSWLTYGGTVAEDTAVDCIRRAYDLGVTFFDTANVYGHGAAEQVVGKALAGVERSSYVLGTKVYFPMGDPTRPGDPTRATPNDRGLSRKHITEQLDASLRRLGVDYIDLYQCHRYDEATPLEETCRTMDDAVRAGKILYWGVSEWRADQIVAAVDLCTARGWVPPASNQPQYSGLWRGIEERILPTSEERGLGTLVWSPLAMGVLTGKYRSVGDLPTGSRAAGEHAGEMRRYLTSDVLDAVARLRPLADEAGVTLAQLALAWCLRLPAVSSVIVGATRPEHVDDNVAAADVSLDPDLVARMDAVLAPVARR